MKKSEKKTLLAIVFVTLGLYILGVMFIPYLTLTAADGTWIASIYTHFADVKASLKSDVLFILIVLGVLVALYYFWIYKPKHVKGRNRKEISLSRKIGFGLFVVYGLLLITLPYITLPIDATAYLVSFFDHFQGVKDAIKSDFAFLTLSGGTLFTLYYFTWYKPKLSK